ncbi:hypothetical protein BZZ01_30290 [Nostocales cyanobacterium HT-58-2]|nr:hypothetical protein BZZ01_30290 [Nostocales cyanobacterium HT-58-2]
MRLLDISLLTLINIAGCLAFPKLLFVVLALQTRHDKFLSTVSKSQKSKAKLTSFPYCTSYKLTNNSFCKFRPHFCDKCSPC